MAQGAHFPPPVLRPDRLAGVLDDPQTGLLGHLHHFVHVGRLAEDVNRQDRLGARGDPTPELRCVQVEGAGIISTKPVWLPPEIDSAVAKR